MFSATAVEGLVASFFLIKPTIVFVTDRAPQPLSSTIATEELPNINHGLSLFCYVLFFSIPVIIFALLFLSPSYNSRNSNPGSRIRLFPPPLPTTVCALHFYREKISVLSSLVDSRRVVLTHATVDDLSS